VNDEVEKKEDKVLFPPDESMELGSLLKEKGFRVLSINTSIYEGGPRERVYSIRFLKKTRRSMILYQVWLEGIEGFIRLIWQPFEEPFGAIRQKKAGNMRL
jgi:hypothetical protein